MAIDTETKRKAFMSFGSITGHFLIEPDSTKPLFWRANFINLYGSNMVSTGSFKNAGIINSGIVGKDTL